jgi:hypothetical protein
MSKKHPPYAPEFSRQMIELIRAGRTPEQLAKEFEPTELLTTAETADKAIFSRAKDWISAANRA